MNYEAYRIYCANRNMVAKLEASGEECSEIAGMKALTQVMEASEPEFLARYNREQDMFASFTPQQRDFICSQIGCWYTIWKDKMWVQDRPNQHWLGTGKEGLKTMICGE